MSEYCPKCEPDFSCCDECVFFIMARPGNGEGMCGFHKVVAHAADFCDNFKCRSLEETLDESKF